jgi:YidC/Oxa1 family membrane protein insertase
MDRKSVIILAASFGLLVSWPALVNRIYPPVKREFVETNSVASATNQQPSSPANAASVPVLTTARPGVLPPAIPAPGEAEKTLTIENDNARFVFSSHGGGIKTVELKRYQEAVDCRKNGATSGKLVVLNKSAVTSAFALVGGPEVEGDGVYGIEKIGDTIRAEKVLPSGLRVVKEFRLNTNSLMTAKVRVENPGAQAVGFSAHRIVVGTATPVSLRDESISLGIQWYDGSSDQHADESWFANRPLGCLPGTPRTEYSSTGSSNVVWVAANNQFFTMIAVPEHPAPLMTARRLLLTPPTEAQLAAEPQAMRQPFGYETAMAYPEATIPPGQAIERSFEFYAGPKEYYSLSKLPKNLDLVMGFGGFFGFFAKALLLSMNGIHTMIPSYGFAIIAITVIIKLCFWPLTTASTRSMKRMAELQPQMKALQEKYKDDPKKMNVKLMAFMKENKVSPLGGCLPMLLQIPVFFGFYRMLQSAIELRGAKFLWACDLSQADTVWVIPGLDFPVNPTPLLMGVTMLWQARLTPPSPGMDPVQQKMMKYMPLMFMAFLYKMSAGLTLYWTIQNLLTIAQMKITRSKSPAAPAKALPASVKIVPKKK